MSVAFPLDLGTERYCRSGLENRLRCTSVSLVCYAQGGNKLILRFVRRALQTAHMRSLGMIDVHTSLHCVSYAVYNQASQVTG